ncbi:MAG: hypothetical protein IJ165_11135 [Proteobacteria bacterium]|nr:hypothetical protein [Pseudomonadota bacterium]
MNPLLFKGFGYAKALIFGEYAVMHGLPGLAIALPQTCQVTINCRRTPSDPSAFQLALEQQFLKQTGTSASVELSLDRFFDSENRKLGIGSSAAAVVGMNIAMCDYLKRDVRILDMIQMHRALQNHMGSGIDIITSYAGGCILASHCPDHPVIERIPRSHIPLIEVFSLHAPAPTLRYIQAARRASHIPGYQHIISMLGEISQALADAARNANIGAFLDILSLMPQQLRALGKVLELPVWPDIMDKIAQIAQNHHVIVKTSGAGGGDIMLALAQDTSALESFAEELSHFSPKITRIPSDIPPERGSLLL